MKNSKTSILLALGAAAALVLCGAAPARASDSTLKDAILEGRVKGHLLDDVGENAMKIEVEASNGVVSLRGTVPSSIVQKTALQTARSTKGVTKVVDLLRTGS